MPFHFITSGKVKCWWLYEVQTCQSSTVVWNPTLICRFACMYTAEHLTEDIKMLL